MAVEYNIENMEQGATFDDTACPPFVLKYADGSLFDLTDWSARSEIRKKYADVAETATFTVTVDIVAASLQLSLTAAQTAVLAAGSYVYDLEIYTADVVPIVRRVVQGTITVTPEATK